MLENFYEMLTRSVNSSKRSISGVIGDVKLSPETNVKKKLRTVSDEVESKDDVVEDVKVNVRNIESTSKFIGAHVSAAGGLQNAPINAAGMGAKSFALFLKSQRQWTSKPMDSQIVEQFRKQCELNCFSPDVILPHGSYLLNCGAPNADTLKKSRDAIVDELQRCELLGLTLYNFHPGSSCGTITVDECLDRIGETINLAHKQTKHVITVVENMSRQGHTVGGDFKELRGIIDRIEDKSRIGVCLDTCHAFAAGYDLSTKDGFQKTMDEFDVIVGMKYLKALHLNDSKGRLGCHLDRHECIGKGHIGVDGFKRIINDNRFNNMPLILETPYTSDAFYAKEISLLYLLEDATVMT